MFKSGVCLTTARYTAVVVSCDHHRQQKRTKGFRSRRRRVNARSAAVHTGIKEYPGRLTTTWLFKGSTCFAATHDHALSPARSPPTRANPVYTETNCHHLHAKAPRCLDGLQSLKVTRPQYEYLQRETRHHQSTRLIQPSVWNACK